eukprot:scaffold163783_cov32-Tisochrysis_lutea.AAC.4
MRSVTLPCYSHPHRHPCRQGVIRECTSTSALRSSHSWQSLTSGHFIEITSCNRNRYPYQGGDTPHHLIAAGTSTDLIHTYPAPMDIVRQARAIPIATEWPQLQRCQEATSAREGYKAGEAMNRKISNELRSERVRAVGNDSLNRL